MTTRLAKNQQFIKNIGLSVNVEFYTWKQSDTYFKYSFISPVVSSIGEAQTFLSYVVKMIYIYTDVKNLILNPEKDFEVEKDIQDNYNYFISACLDIPSLTLGFGYKLAQKLAEENSLEVDAFWDCSLLDQVNFYLSHLQKIKGEGEKFLEFWMYEQAEIHYTLQEIASGNLDYSRIEQLTPKGRELREKGYHAAASVVSMCELQGITESKIIRIMKILFLE